MIKEKVLDCLYMLGFQPELIDEDFGNRFSYEDLTILYNPLDFSPLRMSGRNDSV